MPSLTSLLAGDTKTQISTSNKLELETRRVLVNTTIAFSYIILNNALQDCFDDSLWLCDGLGGKFERLAGQGEV